MRKLKLKIDEKDYLLELNRNSIKWLEANGFSIVDFENKPVTYYDLVWESLFKANHKEVDSKRAMELLESYEKDHNPAEVIKFAIEEYSSFMNALADTSLKKKETLEIIEA